ncbi:hypothetical protein F5972_11945 [Microbispora cellulosiformans]|uniref:Uncharacterized protein n=1 Tax=Microbispora cellulosiformans TaxID=2614688 RepID=A0A5J5K5N4_9ACTN|nr:hypothetical protein [Microbispora cellulosiformans]KAA9378940.1 hypothetical protein F5972_11945 [Microbispora cellulosiformans]
MARSSSRARGLRIPAGGDGGADSFGATGGGFVRGNSFPGLSLDTFGLAPDRHGSLVSLLSSDGGGMRLGEGFPAKLIRRIARRACIPSGAQLTPQIDRAKAGLTLLHSSGKVEGHVNRVKMLGFVPAEDLEQAELDAMQDEVEHEAADLAAFNLRPSHEETGCRDLSMWIDVCYLVPDVRDGKSMANDQETRSRILGTGL